LSALQDQLANDGFAISESAFNEDEVRVLVEALAPVEDEILKAGRGGLRDVLRKVPTLAALVRHPNVRQSVADVLGPDSFAVRAILFDKHPGANWKVVWHQDLTIAVDRSADVPGYGPWSVKAGIPHVQPPVRVLEHMVAVRVHLDPCGLENGPLRVIPGSHRAGRLSGSQIDALRSQVAEVNCVVGRGGLLVMRPLLVHASAPAQRATHRRVVHIEFAACELDGGVDWFERWPCAA
jgi:ectoine hydroxylase-related dioxygenase (phytanoyl-CoA dioxygenase family)